jgi:ubiquitin-like domain-containing CTD phosphatase 1
MNLNKIHLICSWNGKKYPLEINNDDSIVDLKKFLFEITNVAPERQKLIGLVKGKLPADTTKLRDVGSRNSFILMGTVEKDILIETTVDNQVVNVTF